MSNMGSSVSYVRAKGETTEWEDILRARGILPPDTAAEEEKAREDALAEAIEKRQAEYDPLEHKTLTELEELAEDSEYADTHVLDAYRRKRVAELKAMAAKNKFGQVLDLSRDAFVKEVTEASKACWVVVLLYKDGIPDAKLMGDIVNRHSYFPAAMRVQLAAKHKAVKFMRIVADQCIEGYPDRNVPTLLLYHDGACAEQVVGLSSFGGRSATVDIVEWVLAKKGVMETELEEDPRGSSLFRGAAAARAYARRGSSDDDDD